MFFRSGNEEKMMSLLTPLNVNCHASDGRKVFLFKIWFKNLVSHFLTRFQECFNIDSILFNIGREKRLYISSTCLVFVFKPLKHYVGIFHGGAINTQLFSWNFSLTLISAVIKKGGLFIDSYMLSWRNTCRPLACHTPKASYCCCFRKRLFITLVVVLLKRYLKMFKISFFFQIIP